VLLLFVPAGRESSSDAAGGGRGGANRVRVTRRELLNWAQEALTAAGVEEARAKAELLLVNAEEITTRVLYLHPDAPVPPAAERRFRQWMARAAQHEPVRYITGRVEFYGLEFLVDRRVLIPRPETELLVDEALARMAGRGKSPCPTRQPVIADIGTGSGCIAVTLAKHLPEARLDACDASAAALEVARENARRHGVEARITFWRGHLLEPLAEPVDLIVSNPPYVSTAELATLPREIREFEPVEALHGGEDGLDAIRQILAEAPRHLRAGGAVIVEIGSGQGAGALEIARRHFPGARVELRQDYGRLDRVLIARE